MSVEKRNALSNKKKKARQKAEEEARLEKEEAEKGLLNMPPVDMETGEILTDDVVLDVPPFRRRVGGTRNHLASS